MNDYLNKNPFGIRIGHQDKKAVEFLAEAIRGSIREDTIVICIGTDRCIGDSLGPLVGTILECKGFRLPIYGTLEKPIHAVNLESSLTEIQRLHPKAFVVSVDACLGEEDSIGYIHIKKGPIFPGKGVGKKLPGVGHISIVGIVDKVNTEDYLSIHNIRLSLIMKMAQVIANAFLQATLLS